MLSHGKSTCIGASAHTKPQPLYRVHTGYFEPKRYSLVSIEGRKINGQREFIFRGERSNGRSWVTQRSVCAYRKTLRLYMQLYIWWMESAVGRCKVATISEPNWSYLAWYIFLLSAGIQYPGMSESTCRIAALRCSWKNIVLDTIHGFLIYAWIQDKKLVRNLVCWLLG